MKRMCFYINLLEANVFLEFFESLVPARDVHRLQQLEGLWSKTASHGFQHEKETILFFCLKFENMTFVGVLLLLKCFGFALKLGHLLEPF